MSNSSITDKDILELMIKRQETEATHSWSRHTYFLVVLSLLTLAYSQKPTDIAIQLTFYKILISCIGIALAIVWLATQRRSSSYTDYYKNQANLICEKAKLPKFYSDDVKGFEMRKLLYWLPIAFIVLLSLFIASQIIFFYYPYGINLFTVILGR